MKKLQKSRLRARRPIARYSAVLAGAAVAAIAGNSHVNADCPAPPIQEFEDIFGFCDDFDLVEGPAIFTLDGIEFNSPAATFNIGKYSSQPVSLGTPFDSDALVIRTFWDGATITFPQPIRSLSFQVGQRLNMADLPVHNLLVEDEVIATFGSTIQRPGYVNVTFPEPVTEVRLQQVSGSSDQLGIDKFSYQVDLCDYTWDGSIGQPGLSGAAYSLGTYNGNLVVGGSFQLAGGQTAGNIAKWTANGWQALGQGMNATVESVTEIDGTLYASGWFTNADGNDSNRVARWDGSAWQPLGGGLNQVVMTLAEYNGQLIAGGHFDGGGNPTRIARWDGFSWQPLGTGANSTVFEMMEYNGDLIAAGSFQLIGGVYTDYIAKWNGSTWQALSGGLLNGPVFAVTEYNGELIAAGNFTTANQSTVNYIARWNGSFWQPLGSGMDNEVYALLVHDGDLIAGGAFTSADGQVVNGLARWDGTSWSSVSDDCPGCGVNGSVFALTQYEGQIIAGGNFTEAFAQPANNIVAWGGETAPSNPADLNGDGFVSVSDLLILLQDWGQCDDESDCPADFDGSGSVGVFDLLFLLSNWS